MRLYVSPRRYKIAVVRRFWETSRGGATLQKYRRFFARSANKVWPTLKHSRFLFFSQTSFDAYCVPAQSRRVDVFKISTLIEVPLRRDVVDTYPNDDNDVVTSTEKKHGLRGVQIFYLCRLLRFLSRGLSGDPDFMFAWYAKYESLFKSETFMGLFFETLSLR